MKTQLIYNGLKEPEYPKLGITEQNMVVLFSDPKRGTVVNKGQQYDYELADWSSTWNEIAFEDYVGKVVLNEI